MSALELARLQFGATTIYHFLFVPLTIGLTLFVAIFQTVWYRTGDPGFLRLTRFFGKLMLINFAIGVVTGLVQEFQFGMNWAAYSRYVGDVFGAPLAMEGLIAFFLESTFLGLWIFGWDRLPRGLHLLTIWAVAIGTSLSAFFILAANAWMQHPVGYVLNPVSHRAEMRSIEAVLTNSTALFAFVHTILAAVLTAAMVVLGVCSWQLLRGRDIRVFTRAALIALALGFPAALISAGSGHAFGQLLVDQQPMKMAAAEAKWDTEKPASLSLFAIAGFAKNPGKTSFNIELPFALSVLSGNSVGTKVRGIDELQRAAVARYGPGNYVPVVGVVYWSFRLMVGMSILMTLITAAGLALAWRGRLATSRWFLRGAVFAIALPFIANIAGWVFTEMGRQPWVVWGLLRTSDAVSANVSRFEVGLSLVGFVLLYGGLAVVDFMLMRRYATRELEPYAVVPGGGPVEPDKPLSMIY